MRKKKSIKKLLKSMLKLFFNFFCCCLNKKASINTVFFSEWIEKRSKGICFEGDYN